LISLGFPDGMAVALSPGMTHTNLLAELHHTIRQLADQVDDLGPVAQALRRVADDLTVTPPTTPPPLCPRALDVLLYQALDEGSLDGRAFDRVMLLGTRALGQLSARRATTRATA
jgi:hypothetical protein